MSKNKTPDKYKVALLQLGFGKNANENLKEGG